ncbi:MAG: hypothetical protein Kow006_18750 [Gammaproteobacteria bacterium]
MKRFNTTLALLLGAQLLLAAGLYWAQRPAAEPGAAEPLLSFDAGAVDRVVIAADGGSEATLVKRDGVWRLPDYHDLPADADKVTSMLEKLGRLKGGWPVATTESARERFDVDEKRYQRLITLYDGDEVLGKIYLGTSPGFRQVHARREDSEEIFAVAFNSYEAPGKDSEWFDKELLRPTGEIEAIEAPDFAVIKTEGQWTLREKKKGEAIVAEKVDELIRDLKGVWAIEAADDATAERLSGQAPERRLKLKTRDRQIEYRLYKEGDDHFLARSDLDRPFKVSKSDYEALTGYSADKIVRRSDQEPEAGEPVKG